MKEKRLLIEQVPRIRLSDIRANLAPGAETVSINFKGAVVHLTVAWRPRLPFGGTRAYLVCAHCDRATESLFLVPFLACRRCLNLGYRSEALSPLWRKSERLRKLQKRAGVDVSRYPRPMPVRKKRQRWASYTALCRKIERADADFAAAFLQSRHGGRLR